MNITTRFSIGDMITNGEFEGEVSAIQANVEGTYTVVSYMCVCGRDRRVIREAEAKESTSVRLDPEDQRYLSQMIAPFYGEVEWIMKETNECYSFVDPDDIREWITVKTADQRISFGKFRKGRHYPRMRANKRYTVKELGL